MARTFTVDLLTMGESFERWCTARNKTRSQAIRELVGKVLAAEHDAIFGNTAAMDSVEPVQELWEHKDAPNRWCFTLRLTDEERDRLRKQSAATGLPAARYLACLLSAAETGRTVVAGNDAVQALMESNHQLAWIGRSLNESARQGAGVRERDANSQSEELHEVLGDLRQHLACAAAVLTLVENSRCGNPREPHRVRRIGTKT